MAFLLAARFVKELPDKEVNTYMITFNKEKDIEELLRGITKLSPEDFIALAKVMDIKMSTVNKDTGEYAVRDAEDVINDMIAAFRKYKHKERKIILKAVKNSGSRS
jgi:hypothetical protein